MVKNLPAVQETWVQSLIWEDLMEKDLIEEDEKVESHHQCNGHELGQTLGDSEGQKGPACCSPWGHNESDMTELLKNNIEMGTSVLQRDSENH